MTFHVLVIAVYWCCALALSAYALCQMHLLSLFFRHRRRPLPNAQLGAELPRVTVQLPLYNEAAVVEGLIDACCALDWPAAALQIQVLDDSTDETTALAEARCEVWRARGIDVAVVRRPTRTDYKAGALAYGLTQARGELIAIFDADFRPEPDFLRRAAAHMVDGAGFVQARWAYRNRDENLFTRVLAFHMDAHFTIEQRARSAALWMGFNGTAGIWRRRCIDEAGGWQGDTLTEDLDLAIRAQLKGWRGVYVDDLEVSSEVPATLPSIRTQQHRWMKGGAQVLRKLLGTLLRSDAPLLTRVQMAAQLLGTMLFVVVTVLVLLTPVMLSIGVHNPELWPWLLPPGLAMQLVLLGLGVTYLSTCVHRVGLGPGLRRWAVGLPSLLTLSTGLCVHNSLAALEGLRGKPSPFLRTPKKGDGALRPGDIPVPPRHWVLEAALALWTMTGALAVLWQGNVSGALFASLQGVGLAATVGFTLGPWLRLRAGALPVQAALSAAPGGRHASDHPPRGGAGARANADARSEH